MIHLFFWMTIGYIYSEWSMRKRGKSWVMLISDAKSYAPNISGFSRGILILICILFTIFIWPLGLAVDLIEGFDS